MAQLLRLFMQWLPTDYLEPQLPPCELQSAATCCPPPPCPVCAAAATACCCCCCVLLQRAAAAIIVSCCNQSLHSQQTTTDNDRRVCWKQPAKVTAAAGLQESAVAQKTPPIPTHWLHLQHLQALATRPLGHALHFCRLLCTVLSTATNHPTISCTRANCLCI